jgi:hypothetical protein
MPRGKENTLKEAIDAFIDQAHIRSKYNEARLTQGWESLVGKTIASHTRSIRIRNDALTLTLDSSPLRNEMVQLHQQVIDRVNEFLGERAIKELIIK